MCLSLRLSPLEAAFVRQVADSLEISMNKFIRALIDRTFYEFNDFTKEDKNNGL